MTVTPLQWPSLFNGHLSNNNHLSTSSTFLQSPHLYNSHLGTTVTSLQWPSLFNSYISPNNHLSTRATILQWPHLYKRHLFYNGHLTTMATSLLTATSCQGPFLYKTTSVKQTWIEKLLRTTCQENAVMWNLELWEWHAKGRVFVNRSLHWPVELLPTCNERWAW